jgi:hypothetical protein
MPGTNAPWWAGSGGHAGWSANTAISMSATTTAKRRPVVNWFRTVTNLPVLRIL